MIDTLEWSYDAAPTGGRLTAVYGSTTLLDVNITTGGPGQMQWPSGLTNNTKNEALVVTLASGAGTVVGKLSVHYK